VRTAQIKTSKRGSSRPKAKLRGIVAEVYAINPLSKRKIEGTVSFVPDIVTLGPTKLKK